MKTIAISGVIGYDVLGKDIRAQLDEAKGDDIEIQVSSPGGYVYEGLEIYNLIKNYQGKKTTRLMGLAASMASYIVLAGDRVIAEDNAIYMVHNPWGGAVGDYRDMKKSAEVLDGMAKLLARAYSRKSGKPMAAMREMMDANTFLYGDEILKAGFVDEITPAGEGPETKEEAAAIARMKMDECKEKVKAESDATEKIAALIGDVISADIIPVVDRTTPAITAEIKKEGVMDKKTLEKEHPEVFAEVVEIGAKKERDRIAALTKWQDADAENSRVQAIVKEAVASGKTEADVMPQLLVALKDAPKKDGENPPEVGTKTAQTATGTAPADALGADEELLIKSMGISREAYLEQKKKEGK